MTVAASVWLTGCSGPGKEAPDDSAREPGTAVIRVDEDTGRQLGLEVRAAAAAASSVHVVATGQLQTNEDRTWTVSAFTDGKIVDVPVHVGDVVRKDQVLARMHSHEVHDSRATYRQTTAALRQQQILAEQALRVRDRTKRLFDLKAASREQLEAAETQVRSTQMSVADAEAEVEKAKFHLVEYLEVPLERSTSEGSSDSDSDALVIRAPAAGTAMERQASVGTVVTAGDPVFTISDLSSLWMIAAVNESDMPYVRTGQHVNVSVRAYPDRKFKARVLRLGERLDPQTRTLQVRLFLPNPVELLKPGMFATAEFASAPSGRKVIQVPESAVQQWNGSKVVFIQTSEGTYAPRPVSTGSTLNGQVEILAGVEAGTPVVVNGAFLLRSELLKGRPE
jgi:multidrug efflux pump subunit AcrA (membrane-fusion protein)